MSRLSHRGRAGWGVWEGISHTLFLSLHDMPDTSSNWLQKPVMTKSKTKRLKTILVLKALQKERLSVPTTSTALCREGPPVVGTDSSQAYVGQPSQL
ncbi:hypothetical protein FQA47_024613 [Oryzias melastigma]|uniref:Uncharacterized protein n=1 Tax=Oryzias melastigma TaxID=30732 RepID=A0A834CLB1_ORYME|nr:hypothetical protein FQA47_024613 [Oryzias melastigma]